MKQIAIINGPNLNLLGRREPEIYGTLTFEKYFESLKANYKGIDLSYFQSNSEGGLIDHIHEIGFRVNGVVINAGAYTHTSLAIADAISAISAPVVEVHISNVYAREPFRHHSFISVNCAGIIVGCGLKGYALGVDYLLSLEGADEG